MNLQSCQTLFKEEAEFEKMFYINFPKYLTEFQARIILFKVNQYKRKNDFVTSKTE